MEFHSKLNCFSKYLQDKFYIKNNIEKQNLIDGTHQTDFEPLSILDIFFDVPKDSYMSAIYIGTGIDDQVKVQFICQEYSLFRTEYQLEMVYGNQISSVLKDVKSLLTGDGITVNYERCGNPKVYRDNFSQNGKTRTVYVDEYLINF